jgi:hypothetical protein
MYRIKVSGKGNLRTLTLPTVNFPPVLEAYDPRYKEDIKVNASGISGYKQNEYLLIPRSGGRYTLPGGSFSWFDPRLGRYQSYRWPDTTLVVEGAAAPGGGMATDNQSVQTLAEDIRFIDTQPSAAVQPVRYWGSPIMLVLMLLALLMWPASYVWPWLTGRKSHAKKSAAQALQRWKKQAVQLPADQLPLHILQCLTEASGHWVHLEPGQVDAAALQRSWAAVVGPEQALQLAQLWSQAEVARYAPGGIQHEPLRHMWKNALNIMESCA